MIHKRCSEMLLELIIDMLMREKLVEEALEGGGVVCDVSDP